MADITTPDAATPSSAGTVFEYDGTWCAAHDYEDYLLAAGVPAALIALHADALDSLDGACDNFAALSVLRAAKPGTAGHSGFDEAALDTLEAALGSLEDHVHGECPCAADAWSTHLDRVSDALLSLMRRARWWLAIGADTALPLETFCSGDAPDRLLRFLQLDGSQEARTSRFEFSPDGPRIRAHVTHESRDGAVHRLGVELTPASFPEVVDELEELGVDQGPGMLAQAAHALGQGAHPVAVLAAGHAYVGRSSHELRQLVAAATEANFSTQEDLEALRAVLDGWQGSSLGAFHAAKAASA